MYVRFGNLSINEIEARLGITFTEEHRNLLTETKQDQVSSSKDPNYKIGANEWHGFDLPFTQIHCGSLRFAKEITKIIKSYMTDGAFPKEGAKLGITNELLEEEKFGYAQRQNMIEKGLEIYIGHEIAKHEWKNDRIRFFIKEKETNTMVVLQELETTRDPEIMSELIVPNADRPYEFRSYKTDEDGNFIKEDGEYVIESSRKSDPIRKKKSAENVYIVEDNYSKMTLTLWDGKPVKNIM